MKKILLLAFLFTQILGISFAQDTITKVPRIKKMKGTFYVTWGYQRNSYSNADTRFHDNSNPPAGNYDFTVHDMVANDQPDFDHITDRPISVPQYVFNIGYLFNDKRDLGVEVCWDHLKYVMTRNQTANVSGLIDGENVNGPMVLSPNWIRFEHTNGNNYLMASLVKRFKLFHKERKFHKVSFITKIGAGALIPKTDSYILGLHNDGPFRVSGFVIGASAGLRYDFFRYFFVDVAAKGCFVDYTNIKLYGEGRAEQTFWSSQLIWSAGLNLPLSKD